MAASVLGIRAEPSQFYWAIVTGTRGVPVMHTRDKAAAPVSSEEPDSLVWYRARMDSILSQHKPSVVAIRYPEVFGVKVNDGTYKRLRIEGVIVEVARSNGCKVVTGRLIQIGTRLGTKTAKKYLEEKDDLRGINLSGIPKLAREAIVAAVSALPGGEEVGL